MYGTYQLLRFFSLIGSTLMRPLERCIGAAALLLQSQTVPTTGHSDPLKRRLQYQPIIPTNDGCLAYWACGNASTRRIHGTEASTTPDVPRPASLWLSLAQPLHSIKHILRSMKILRLEPPRPRRNYMIARRLDDTRPVVAFVRRDRLDWAFLFANTK
ncbi:hypothetical protein BDN70DRAFT_896879 [Pholiota conissans]|uniref:Uncharacterized protein n=1 Tax=Pholiota conissans TaxID=109636 RepID=A0A9P5YWY4_9AGAR|nr:hypothetical protein BDN70DRAFT_896879 [Pholiota conissans]